MILVCGETLFDLFMDREGQADEESGLSGQISLKVSPPKVSSPRVSPPRVSPRLSLKAVAGGSPFNVAIGLARLGQPVGLSTYLAHDTLGQRLYDILEQEGICLDYLCYSSSPTPLALVGGKDVPNYSFYEIQPQKSLEKAETSPALHSSIQALHAGSYSLVTEPFQTDLNRLLASKSKSLFLSLDPNIRASVEPDITRWRIRVEQLAGQTSLIKISAEDLNILYPDQKSEDFAAGMIGSGVKLVVVTDSAQPIKAWAGNGASAVLEPEKIEVVDTVGAGDSFQAALLAALFGDPQTPPDLDLLSSDRLHHILTFAREAAALTCKRQGADLPFLHEIR